MTALWLIILLKWNLHNRLSVGSRAWINKKPISDICLRSLASLDKSALLNAWAPVQFFCKGGNSIEGFTCKVSIKDWTEMNHITTFVVDVYYYCGVCLFVK